MVGRSRAAVSKWLSGKDVPSADSVEEIAASLRISKAEVTRQLYGSTPQGLRPHVRDLLEEVNRRLPREVDVFPTSTFMADDEQGAAANSIFLPYPLKHLGERNLQAFVATGLYMVPAVMPGDIVIVDPNAPIQIGDLVRTGIVLEVPGENPSSSIQQGNLVEIDATPEWSEKYDFDAVTQGGLFRDIVESGRT